MPSARVQKSSYVRTRIRPCQSCCVDCCPSRTKGQSVELLAHDAELSPNQAAALLKMSRPFLLAFMDRGDLPFHRVGTHRRIKMSDLLTFMDQREAGSAIVAGALHKPTSRGRQEPFTQEELQELEDF